MRNYTLKIVKYGVQFSAILLASKRFTHKSDKNYLKGTAKCKIYCPIYTLY